MAVAVWGVLYVEIGEMIWLFVWRSRGTGKPWDGAAEGVELLKIVAGESYQVDSFQRCWLACNYR